ncbi:MAG: YbhB/YbcL family Raf kinase inhibitor-like protein [Gammaproteobacteria bacterium]|nr:YbhB/YbcL family Raf kinase inhibitor-like protein [Gammaproteobacteria bacterium]
MEFHIEDIEDGGWIPERFAFGVPDSDRRMRFGANRNPALHWSGAPAGTRTMVLIMHDDDVPARADDVNREGRTIAVDFPRARFYHWLTVDLPPNSEGFLEGSASKKVTAHGKDKKIGPLGGRQGLNDFTGFMSSDPEMAGNYFGYDGPCPPWNDERLHHYHFTLYATDLESCPVEEGYAGADLEAALEGHIMDSARISGVYSLYPPLLEERPRKPADED